jgi:hypothetical protein
MTAIERALLGQAVGLMVRAERLKDTNHTVQLEIASARLLATVGCRGCANKSIN